MASYRPGHFVATYDLRLLICSKARLPSVMAYYLISVRQLRALTVDSLVIR